MDITKYYARAGEKPLDEIKPDGGFFSIFRTVACIGDSLSSGEMEAFDENGKRSCHDYFEYSWGQFMARATGTTVYNFSEGGMTAEGYYNSFADEKGFWNPELACRAYIIALGVNDVLNPDKPFGSADDIDPENPENNALNYAGYMGKIISRYKKISPKARFFLMTPLHSCWSDDGKVDRIAALLHDIAAKFEFTYVLDFAKYAPCHDEEFRKHFYLAGHLNAMGYQLTAWQVMSYIDYIIRHNPDDFTQTAFIGKDVHNCAAKW